MKKRPIAAACLLLGGCLLLSACTGAAIPGDYRIPTAQELEDALSAIDADALFGNATAEDRSFGLSFKFTLDTSTEGPSGTQSTAIQADYLFCSDAAQTAGKGSFAIRETAEVGKTELEADLFHDADFLYLDMASNGAEGRAKISLSDLLASDELSSFMPSLTQEDALGTLEALSQAGMAVGMDDRDGLKLRLRANDGFYHTIARYIAAENGALCKFEDSVLEFYLYINADGLFEQLSAIVDITANLDGMGGTQVVRAEGNFIIRRSEKKVQLPDGLDTYPLHSISLTPSAPSEPSVPSVPPEPSWPLGDPEYKSPQTTADGVVTALDIPADEQSTTLYDATTDTLIHVLPDSLIVYDAVTGESLYTERSLLNIECADVWNGKLLLGLGRAQQIVVIDLNAGYRRTTLSTPIGVLEIAAMEKEIVYCDGDQWGMAYRCGYNGEDMRLLIDSVHAPAVTPNRADNFVYITERFISDSGLYFIDLTSGTSFDVTSFSEFSATAPASFDGTYVHFCGVAFDGRTGSRVSSSDITEFYPFHAETPVKTVYISERYSFVQTVTLKLLVYDRTEAKFVYLADFCPRTVWERADGTFLALCEPAGSAAILDLSKL